MDHVLREDLWKITSIHVWYIVWLIIFMQKANLNNVHAGVNIAEKSFHTAACFLRIRKQILLNILLITIHVLFMSAVSPYALRARGVLIPPPGPCVTFSARRGACGWRFLASFRPHHYEKRGLFFSLPRVYIFCPWSATGGGSGFCYWSINNTMRTAAIRVTEK